MIRESIYIYLVVTSACFPLCRYLVHHYKAIALCHLSLLPLTVLFLRCLPIGSPSLFCMLCPCRFHSHKVSPCLAKPTMLLAICTSNVCFHAQYGLYFLIAICCSSQLPLNFFSDISLIIVSSCHALFKGISSTCSTLVFPFFFGKLLPLSFISASPNPYKLFILTTLLFGIGKGKTGATIGSAGCREVFTLIPEEIKVVKRLLAHHKRVERMG
ncbi:hypothetical protein L7F22_001223 [Adiantum nelumboides]|nr:hypothetical protein [Adiantum nelumboides]